MSTPHSDRRACIQQSFISLPETYIDFDFLKKLSVAKETGFLKKSVVDSAKNLIKSLRNVKENNCVYEQTLYKINKDDSVRVGRYYPKRGGACCHNMGAGGRLRRILMAEKYVELDMENAEPKLLLCKYPNSPQLLMYIRDR